MRDRDSGKGALWEVASDGAGLHPLLRGPVSGAERDNDYSGTWTPSGKYYLFLRSRSSTVASIWAIREHRAWQPVFGPRPVQIYSTTMDLPSLAPSPDGKRAFFAGGQERRELVRYEAGRGQFMTYLSGVAGRWIDYSHHERWVAYTIAADDTLWRSRPDGAERVLLTPAPLHAGKQHWSPDGTRIAFAGSWTGEPVRVYVIDASGPADKVPDAVTPVPFTDREPSWSPDGNSLLFSRGLPSVSSLYIMEWKTRKAELVPGSRALSRPAWSPDPRYIAATDADGSRILLFDFHTRQWTLLATGVGLRQSQNRARSQLAPTPPIECDRVCAVRPGTRRCADRLGDSQQFGPLRARLGPAIVNLQTRLKSPGRITLGQLRKVPLPGLANRRARPV
jgi:WD40 repeat protein